jgi:hypothetical protein
MVAVAVAYAWKNRPYRRPGAEADNEWRDEMALRADKVTRRSGGFGGDIGGDL